MDDHGPDYRRSFLFPLLLIFLGIVFLLNNLNIITGNFWDTLVQLWPVLIILLGLDALFRRDGLVGPVFLIGVGTVILLGNLGYLALNVWQVIIRLWPLLLVAIGLDIIVGRRSFIGSLVGLVILLALMVGTLWYFGIRPNAGQPITGEKISQALGGARQARIVLDPAVGAMRVDSVPAPDGLIEGTVHVIGSERVSQDFSVSSGTATYSLQGTGGVMIGFSTGTGDRWSWDLSVTPSIPIDLETSLGAGQTEIDLTGMEVIGLDVSYGVGQTTVILPQTGDFSGKVDGAIGQIVIVVPRGLGVQIRSDTGLANINVPADFQSTGDQYVSPGYVQGSSQNGINLSVSQVIGNIEVRYTNGQ
jgi:hypothetical protein